MYQEILERNDHLENFISSFARNKTFQKLSTQVNALEEVFGLFTQDHPEFEEEGTTGWDMMQNAQSVVGDLKAQMQDLIVKGYNEIDRRFGAKFAHHIADYEQFSSTIAREGETVAYVDDSYLVMFNVYSPNEHEVLTKIPMDMADYHVILPESIYNEFIYKKSAIINTHGTTDGGTGKTVLTWSAEISLGGELDVFPIEFDDCCPYGLILEEGDKVFGYIDEDTQRFVIQEVKEKFTPHVKWFYKK